MLHFLGSDLDLGVDEILERYDGPRLFAGHDGWGQEWLGAEIHRTISRAEWLCAPQSALALDCVRCGRAEVRDALRHSASGTAVLVTLDAHTVADRTLLCAELGDDVLPASGWRLSRDPGPGQVAVPADPDTPPDVVTVPSTVAVTAAPDAACACPTAS
jgi:hypothetical protein